MSSYGFGFAHTLPTANFGEGPITLQGHITRRVIGACE
jgi:hypothetical protein